VTFSVAAERDECDVPSSHRMAGHDSSSGRSRRMTPQPDRQSLQLGFQPFPGERTPLNTHFTSLQCDQIGRDILGKSDTKIV
jgi:hypothetical protein